jgi:hypothetical protein
VLTTSATNMHFYSSAICSCMCCRHYSLFCNRWQSDAVLFYPVAGLPFCTLCLLMLDFVNAQLLLRHQAGCHLVLYVLACYIIELDLRLKSLETYFQFERVRGATDLLHVVCIYYCYLLVCVPMPATWNRFIG